MQQNDTPHLKVSQRGQWTFRRNLTPNARHVAEYLDRAPSGHEFAISATEIGDAIGLTAVTVRKKLAELEKAGLIETTSHIRKAYGRVIKLLWRAPSTVAPLTEVKTDGQ